MHFLEAEVEGNVSELFNAIDFSTCFCYTFKNVRVTHKAPWLPGDYSNQPKVYPEILEKRIFFNGKLLINSIFFQCRKIAPQQSIYPEISFQGADFFLLSKMHPIGFLSVLWLFSVSSEQIWKQDFGMHQKIARFQSIRSHQNLTIFRSCLTIKLCSRILDMGVSGPL